MSGRVRVANAAANGSKSTSPAILDRNRVASKCATLRVAEHPEVICAQNGLLPSPLPGATTPIPVMTALRIA